MQKKHLAFDELFDVRAVRIVASVCRTATPRWG
jgi:(p)ppGpp synthase/HD superfamily hydrolase